jgi:hypothetical protein
VAVNAFGPTAANPCTIRVQGIVTAAEAGAITIPQYCHVEGVGEGSVIDLGANRVEFEDYTSALDIVFTSSRPNAAIVSIGGETDVVLKNVKSVATNSGCCFIISSSTNVHLHDCVAEAASVTCRGFIVSGTSSNVRLEGCVADSANFEFALFIADTASAATEYCIFRGAIDVTTGATVTWSHIACSFDPDNCPATIAAGSHVTLSAKRFNQEVIVAESGGDFQALSEAITWITNQGDAAANKLYGVFMMTGNFAEAANVTIPQYVHVSGQGRGTEIEMGNNILSLSDDSSLKDVTVETTMSAATKYCIECNGITGYELFNVLARYTPYTSGANVGFYFHGASEGAAYHCVAEPLGGSATGTVAGFAAEDSAVVLLWDCEADDTTNLDYGLYIGDTADVTTKHCTFRADGDDVYQAAAGTAWSHVATEASPANVTLPGTIVFLPRLRDTVGCGAQSNANRAIPTGAWTAAIFSGVRWDDGVTMGFTTTFWNAANPTRITVPPGCGGRYTMHGNLILAASAAGTLRQLGIRLNGATYIAAQDYRFSGAANTNMAIPCLYQLDAGDFVELMVYQDSGGPLNAIAWGNIGIEFRVERK